MKLFNAKTTKEVKTLIDTGADMNARNVYNRSSLHYANDEGAVRALIEEKKELMKTLMLSRHHVGKYSHPHKVPTLC